MSSAPPQQGTLIVPYRFITIFINTHGEDVKDVPIGSFFGTNAKKHYKLTVSGLTGNITIGSDTVDAIYSQIPRILAHDRTMSPLEKLKEVHKKMHSELNFKHEVEAQSRGQRKFILDRQDEYQRTVLNENWFPEPTLISYNRAYYFTANPIDYVYRTRTAMERNQFGIWLLDASSDIGTVLGFLPGCETAPLSLLKLLGISLSTARTHQSSDETGATTTTLFAIMTDLMIRFGDDIHINVIDITCRYFNWDKYRPAAQQKHNVGRGVQLVGTALATISPRVGTPLLRAGDFLADEVPSVAATEAAKEYQPERVVLDGQKFSVEKWYYDGNIKLSTLPNVWKSEGSSVTSTGILSTQYNLIPVSFGPLKHTIDTTQLFADNVHDIIVNGISLALTHNIEVFHVIRTPTVKIMITLKRKPNMRGIESWLLPGDHDTDTNAYLTLVSIEPTGIRQWMIDPHSALFFKQVYDTVVRREAVIGRRSRSRDRMSSSTGGRKKQKKRGTRRLRVKTNKSKKTRFRYSASYRK